MADEVKVGVIGCGGIAQGHIERLLSIPQARVAALMDTDAARLEASLERHPALAGVAQFGDYKEMIAQADLDATVICSPHYVHHAQIVDSLRAGLHVLTEKPMVCSIDDARSVMAEEGKAGKVVSISYQRHSQAEFQFIRDSISSGDAGQVQYVSAFQGQQWLELVAGTWRQSMELSCGGQLNDSGSHLIDIILWVTGLAVEEVSASIENFDTEVDINSTVSIRFKNGALGSLSVVGNCPVFYEDITIVCSKWAFFMRRGQLSYKTGMQGEMHSLSEFSYGSPSADHNFIDAILGCAEPLAPSICGLRTIELTEAAWRAAETGQPVRM